MVKINKVTTKSGDRGETGLFGKGRIRKDSIRVEAIGSVDEVQAILGMLRSLADIGCIPQAALLLKKIQNDLFDLGSELSAADGNKSPCPICQSQIEFIERESELINEKLPELSSFVLPGGSTLNAWLHLARVSIRRAECKVIKCAAEHALNPLIQIYLNRLSDLFFILARSASYHQNVTEILWKPGG